MVPDSAAPVPGLETRARAAASVTPIDEAEFGDLYRRLARPLWGYLRRVTGDAALADDLLQEAFTRLLAESQPPREEPARRAWLYRTASRLAIDAGRRGRREAPAGDEVGTVTAPQAPSRDPILARGMAQAFGDLTRQERALLWLAYVDEAAHPPNPRVVGGGGGGGGGVVVGGRQRVGGSA